MDEGRRRLAGKVAVITGSASGIGRATALLFGREGAQILVADINGGGDATFSHTDVTKADDVRRMVGLSVEAYGRLDILFNNAGIGHRAPVHDCSEEDWDRVIATNLKGVFLGCKYAIPVMLRQGSGTIINTASGAGLVGAVHSPAYCASKGGVVLLTKQLAVDYTLNNIRVNAICPGAVDTPLMDVVYREISEDLVEAKRIYEERLPGHRLMAPEQVAHVALYLASAETQSMTGNAFMI
jgi:NAD(P)-dependent dehydrogenase (short-subunit alcohol dehydrogenase family)